MLILQLIHQLFPRKLLPKSLRTSPHCPRLLLEPLQRVLMSRDQNYGTKDNCLSFLYGKEFPVTRRTCDFHVFCTSVEWIIHNYYESTRTASVEVLTLLNYCLPISSGSSVLTHAYLSKIVHSNNCSVFKFYQLIAHGTNPWPPYALYGTGSLVQGVRLLGYGHFHGQTR